MNRSLQSTSRGGATWVQGRQRALRALLLKLKIEFQLVFMSVSPKGSGRAISNAPSFPRAALEPGGLRFS